MAENLRKVISKNVALASPGDRSRLDRLGHRYLFKYAGKKLIWRSGALVLEARFRAAAQAIGEATRFLGGRHFKDPYLFGAVVLAVLKIPFKLKVASAWCAPEKIQ